MLINAVDDKNEASRIAVTVKSEALIDIELLLLAIDNNVEIER